MMSRRARQRQNLKRLAIGSTVAAAAGYVAGVLTAPKSGKDTRKDIKFATNKGVAEAEKDLKKLHTELDKAIKDAKALGDKGGAKAKKELEKAIASAKVSKQKAREVLSALHEGGAKDKDLDKAVNDSKTAIKHLRTYLKK